MEKTPRQALVMLGWRVSNVVTTLHPLVFTYRRHFTYTRNCRVKRIITPYLVDIWRLGIGVDTIRATG